jgi:hypothetical protein
MTEFQINWSDVEQFWNFLNPDNENFVFQVFKGGAKTKQIDLDNLQDLKALIIDHNLEGIECLSVNPRKQGETKIGSVQRLNTILLDVDVKKERKENGVSHPEDKEKAKEVGRKVKRKLSDLGFTPDLVVDSGNGYHVYCKVDAEMPSLPENNTKKEWRSSLLYRRLQALEKELEELENDVVEIDAITKDAARRVKIPGTWNVKPEIDSKENYRRAKIEYLADEPNTESNTKALEDLEPFQEKEKDSKLSSKDYNDQSDRLEAVLSFDDKFNALYHGSSSGYPSRSEAEAALAVKAIYYGFDPEEIVRDAGIGKYQEMNDSDNLDVYWKPTLEFAESKVADSFPWEDFEGEDEKVKKARHETENLEFSNVSDSDDPIKPDSDANPLDRDNLPFITDHLKGFEYIDRGIRLQGEEYLPVKKAMWYQTHSMVMRRQKAELGDIITDCRYHVAFPMPSGSGKKNIVTFLDKVFRQSGRQEVATPTSLHPEQLIGKTIRRGKKNPDYEEIRGHLDDDLVVIDEAIDLFRSSKEKISETRSYLNEAMDYYGQNRIEKRMTDIPKDQRLTYTPDCNLTIFMQPFQVDEEFALQGTLRRFLIPYSKFDPDIQITGYSKRIQGGRDIALAEAISNIRDQIAKTRSRKEKLNSDYIRVDNNAVEKFEELHKNLVFQGFAHSDKGKNFTRIIDYQLQDLLLKFSAIQAISSGHEKIKEDDIEKAFIDLSDILACMLEYIYRKVIGTLDYNDDWKGARKKDRKCLEWLKEKGATSKSKSGIRIQEYVNKVSEICDIGERQARRKMNDHQENGWISKKQIGQHDSRIWLEIDTEGGQDGQGGHGVKAIRSKVEDESPYFELVKKFSDKDKKGVNPDNPDNPESVIIERE